MGPFYANKSREHNILALFNPGALKRAVDDIVRSAKIAPLPDCPLCHGKGSVLKRRLSGRVRKVSCECLNRSVK